MKIKSLRFECETFTKFASIQVFYNKNNAATYARARHYTGQVKGSHSLNTSATLRVC